jgi:long-chain fatty acid transport protein
MLAVTIAVLAPSAGRANPIDAFGFGARGPAMGGAQTAASDDGGANYYNPGILATFREIRIDLGYQIAQPHLTLNGLDTNVDASHGLAVSLSAPGRIGPVRVAVGGGLFLPDQQITRTRTMPSDQPRFVMFDNRPQRLFLASNVAVELTPWLFVGGGIAYMSQLTGEVQLDGRVGFPDGADSELALRIDVDLDPIRYPQAGVLVKPLPWLDVGLAYRGGFGLTVALDFSITGDIGPEGAPPTVEDGFLALLTTYQDLFQPAQVALGFCARATPDLAFAVDAVWHRWSQFENPAAQIDIDYELGEFNDLVDIPDPLPLPDPRFHDIIVPRAGVEWAAARTRRQVWQLRGGYVFEPTPTPVQSGDTNFIDGDKHTASAGGGVTLSRLTDILPLPISIDAYAALTWMPEREHAKVSPVDRIGDYRAGGTILQLGASSRWRF